MSEVPMVENDPFNAEPGLQAHRSFAQAALGVGVRKVSMGVVESQAVGQTGQGCNTANGQAQAPATKQPPLVLDRKPKSIPRDRTRNRDRHQWSWLDRKMRLCHPHSCAGGHDDRCAWLRHRFRVGNSWLQPPS